MVRLKTAVVAELAIMVLALTSAHISSAAGAPGSQAQNPQNQSTPAAPASGCALLPVSLIEKIFGETFEAQPQETKAPPAYKGAWGSSCEYFSKPPFAKGQQTRVDFLVYVEASAAEAKQTFDKAGMFFADKSKPKPSGIGESAYWASMRKDEPTIHVLKGKVHYSLGMQPTNEKQLTDLATAVARGL